jgi:predicted transglutaminase-like cysteine proteinase
VVKQLLYKWFGLTPAPCETCEVLRIQLAGSERERRELLHRLLDAGKPEPIVQPVAEEVAQPVGHTFTPWRVRQQMLETEDRKAAQLTRDKMKEIDELEKAVGLHEPASGER